MSRRSTAQKMQPSDTPHGAERAADKKPIRAFRLIAPEAELASDESLGGELATIEELPRYWAPDDDWRKREERLNALPQFMTEIDGLDILLIASVVFLIV